MNEEAQKESFLNMALTPWEGDILIDENNGIVERERQQFIKNGEQQTQLVVEEAAALLGLEDNKTCDGENININGDIIVEAASNVKKEEHNAKERERRMKLSQTFFSLRSLLPNATRSKKIWSSATIIDKVVDYIPTLQIEIQSLKQKKQDLIKAKETNNQRVVEAHEHQGLGLDDHHNPTVSIHRLCKGEVIIQICVNQTHIMKFSSLIHEAEAQGLQIIAAASAVSVSVSDSDEHPTLTCHLHLKMNGSLQEAIDYESILRKRIISWLR